MAKVGDKHKAFTSFSIENRFIEKNQVLTLADIDDSGLLVLSTNVESDGSIVMTESQLNDTCVKLV